MMDVNGGYRIPPALSGYMARSIRDRVVLWLGEDAIRLRIARQRRDWEMADIILRHMRWLKGLREGLTPIADQDATAEAEG